MLDMAMLKLQYEILNVSPQSIADHLGIPVHFVTEDIKKRGWKVLWPDEDEPTLSIGEDEDTFTADTDRYIEKLRKRLAAYTLAKDALLTSKYLELESNIIDSANIALQSIDPTSTSALKALSALYKDMSKNMKESSLSLSTDDRGVPTVVIKDLSGTR